MATSAGQFDSIYTHGFAHVSVCVPRVKVASPAFNVERTIDLAQQAARDGSVVALFPEMGLSAYSIEDLYHQDALLDAALEAVAKVVRASTELGTILIVGAPLRLENKLFNCGIVIHRGKILGVAPKSYLPNYREFYERRQLTSGFAAMNREIELLGQRGIPFGNDLIYEASDLPGFALHTEICEDVWMPIPPSTYAALAGATVLANLSASNITIGKAAYRRDLCSSQSGRCIAAYLYTAAGQGESTTDLAWDGHAMVYENGTLLTESERFSDDEQVITADIDLDRLRQERMRMNTFNDCVQAHKQEVLAMRRIPIELGLPSGPIALKRGVARFPYVPHDPAQWDDRCHEAYSIQVAGLEQRLRAAGVKKVIIGISGGLDSTQALIVCCRTMDRLNLPRANVLAYTMPGFATSDSTKSNAWKLMKSFGVTGAEIDIRPSARQMLKDIGHLAADGHPMHDITFENVQAGERTSHLFRLANHHNAIVVGTGDLSELALGWATYGVGDHMSHYNVNASVPKTLVQHLIRWQVHRSELAPEARETLQAVLDTEITPELVPPSESGQVQATEATIGPYELQDFHIYYITRFGLRPSKVAFLAHHAWGDKTKGYWPPGMRESDRREYDLATIKKWLRVFLFRFFKTSQFKRSAVPNSPKVGSGGSLSPAKRLARPSDSEADAWLDELDRNVP